MATGFVFDKAANILRRISQEHPNFMEKFPILPKTANQLADAGFQANIPVAALPQQLDHGLIG